MRLFAAFFVCTTDRERKAFMAIVFIFSGLVSFLCWCLCRAADTRVTEIMDESEAKKYGEYLINLKRHETRRRGE